MNIEEFGRRFADAVEGDLNEIVNGSPGCICRRSPEDEPLPRGVFCRALHRPKWRRTDELLDASRRVP